MASALMRAYGDAPAPGGIGPARPTPGSARRGGGHAESAPRSAADISFSEILRMYRGSRHDAEQRGTTGGGGHEFGSVEVFAGFEDESSDDSDLNARDVFGGGDAGGNPRGARPPGDSDEEDAAWRAFCGGAVDDEAPAAGGGLADYLDSRLEDRLELADPDEADAEADAEYALGDCGCN